MTQVALTSTVDHLLYLIDPVVHNNCYLKDYRQKKHSLILLYMFLDDLQNNQVTLHNGVFSMSYSILFGHLFKVMGVPSKEALTIWWGMYYNINKGLSTTRGEYISRCEKANGLYVFYLLPV